MDSQIALTWTKPLFITGVGLSAFTSGILASMSLVTIPAILAHTTNASALACWRQSLQSGVKLAPPLALAATLAHAVNAFINRSSDRARYLAAAAASTLTIVPFTILILQPTNAALFKREEAARGTAAGVESSTVELFRKWGRLNLVRAVFPAVGALVALYAL